MRGRDRDEEKEILMKGWEKDERWMRRRDKEESRDRGEQKGYG